MFRWKAQGSAVEEMRLSTAWVTPFFLDSFPAGVSGRSEPASFSVAGACFGKPLISFSMKEERKGHTRGRNFSEKSPSRSAPLFRHRPLRLCHGDSFGHGAPDGFRRKKRRKRSALRRNQYRRSSRMSEVAPDKRDTPTRSAGT